MALTHAALSVGRGLVAHFAGALVGAHHVHTLAVLTQGVTQLALVHIYRTDTHVQHIRQFLRQTEGERNMENIEKIKLRLGSLRGPAAYLHTRSPRS